MFLHESDVHNLASKLAQEMYMLDSNDAKSVHLGVQQDGKDIFYYQEISDPVLGELIASNMPFTISIQMTGNNKLCFSMGMWAELF